ncbi:DUF4350 domain-containing protein [Haloarcula sp. CBA1130]|uniref:DUF4350 domain-containing protein n=1 Tax=unclassified Haloarcula TaxID=2624677 RepID=UPI001246811B|nr:MULTISPECIES: DUF4350 domain-containing protein [unclassified Haloarcula]KAA9397841.1 DUF4350 domain-containing protein [Haloarcula sp. CBA1129]KAA9402470.1 DUF4350 domain-containing protein [Haloarcula sp. CBA1130]
MALLPLSEDSRLPSLTLPQLLLATYTALTFIALVYAASTSSAAFGAYNSQWDGTGELRNVAADAGANVTVGTNVSQYPTSSADGTVAVVLSPAASYSSSERTRIAEFVRGGGTLVVAEDYRPHGNDLLAAVEADARFDGRPVYDNRNYYRNSSFPEATPAGDYPETTGVDTVVLNYGTTVRAGDATTLVSTSEYAYLDTNGNGELDGEEQLASRPVVTSEPVGDGRVIAVSDPSIFVNAMLERGDNRQFVRNLVANHDTALLDYSHVSSVPPVAAAVLAVQQSDVLLLFCGVVLVGLLFAYDRHLDEYLRDRLREYGGREPEPHLSRDGVEKYLRARHPDWEATQVERVTEAIIKQRPERQRND